MAKLLWNAAGTKTYETGTDRGVLYHRDNNGNYVDGEAWQGLTGVTKSPSGGEANKQYADNQVWLNILSAEMFGATLECMMFPDGFKRYDGLVEAVPGVTLAQQSRKTFGFCYRTLLGNDIDGQDYGYKLHLVYGCLATPSEQAHTTVNDTPAPLTFSYVLSTTPEQVEGFKPTALVEINSTKVNPEDLAALEAQLYGTDLIDPSMPLPSAIIAIFGGAIIVTANEPAFSGNIITIPSITGVEYLIDGEVVPAGTVPITVDTVVQARVLDGYVFSETSDDDWTFIYD